MRNGAGRRLAVVQSAVARAGCSYTQLQIGPDGIGRVRADLLLRHPGGLAGESYKLVDVRTNGMAWGRSRRRWRIDSAGGVK